MFRSISRGFSSVVVASKLPLSKIVATIGPASEQLPMLSYVADAGMRIMRINFSHATYEEADLRIKNLKLCPGTNKNLAGNDINLRGVMLDTQGPEIRTGSFAGVKEIELVAGNQIILSINDDVKKSQTSEKLWISYKRLLESVKPGTSILLDDGAVELIVEEIFADKAEIKCRIQNSGVIGNKRGVNIPGEVVQLPAMSEKDKADIKWGVENDIDYIAASFVRKPADVLEIRAYTASLMAKQTDPRSLPKIISKIESTEAMANFDAILEVSDAIMVARGDLGVEIPLDEVAAAQKNIVRKCNLAGKPVIVATQMLESMVKNPRPTRAEVTDVFNAVVDGADCVMLSGESAKGKYPVQCLTMMNRIVMQAEKFVVTDTGKLTCAHMAPTAGQKDLGVGSAFGVVQASQHFKVACIIVLSKTGKTATNLSRFRPDVPIVTFVPTAKIGRALQLYRAVHPVYFDGIDLSSNSSTPPSLRVDQAVLHATALGYCKQGDNVLVVLAELNTLVASKAPSMRVITVL